MLKKLSLIIAFIFIAFPAYGIQIEDGKGSGNRAEVDSEGKLYVKSVSETQESHIAHDTGRTFFLSSGASNHVTHTATAAGGYLLYLKNNSTTHKLYVEKIMLVTGTAAESFAVMKKPTLGTISNHNVMTPVNTNFGSGNVADATAYTWNEAGNGMGGLTSGTTMLTTTPVVGATVLPIDGSILLSTNDSIGIKVFGAAEVSAAIRFYFKED